MSKAIASRIAGVRLAAIMVILLVPILLLSVLTLRGMQADNTDHLPQLLLPFRQFHNYMQETISSSGFHQTGVKLLYASQKELLDAT